MADSKSEEKKERIDSAVKRVRTAAQSRAKNRAVMSKINTARRPVIEAKPADAAEAASEEADRAEDTEADFGF